MDFYLSIHGQWISIDIHCLALLCSALVLMQCHSGVHFWCSFGANFALFTTRSSRLIREGYGSEKGKLEDWFFIFSNKLVVCDTANFECPDRSACLCIFSPSIDACFCTFTASLFPLKHGTWRGAENKTKMSDKPVKCLGIWQNKTKPQLNMSIISATDVNADDKSTHTFKIAVHCSAGHRHYHHLQFQSVYACIVLMWEEHLAFHMLLEQLLQSTNRRPQWRPIMIIRWHFHYLIALAYGRRRDPFSFSFINSCFV